jgi:phosphoribosylglycinamide formyltransferase 1
MEKIVNIAIFASGGGSNALCIIEHFASVQNINVALIVSNRKDAGVLRHAEQFSIDTFVHSKEESLKGKLIEVLLENQINFIVLAGYLKKVENDLLDQYPKRIVNIHPALLPKFGGKNMYGMNVHNAVVEAAEKESGITIHYVNEHYDEGNIIAQFKCNISPNESSSMVQEKVLHLEHENYAKIIEQLIRDL